MLLFSVRQGPGGHDSISEVSFAVILLQKQRALSCLYYKTDTLKCKGWIV